MLVMLTILLVLTYYHYLYFLSIHGVLLLLIGNYHEISPKLMHLTLAFVKWGENHPNGICRVLNGIIKTACSICINMYNS